MSLILSSIIKSCSGKLITFIFDSESALDVFNKMIKEYKDHQPEVFDETSINDHFNYYNNLNGLSFITTQSKLDNYRLNAISTKKCAVVSSLVENGNNIPVAYLSTSDICYLVSINDKIITFKSVKIRSHYLSEVVDDQFSLRVR